MGVTRTGFRGYFQGVYNRQLGKKINIFCNGLQPPKAAVVPSLPLRHPASRCALRRIGSDDGSKQDALRSLGEGGPVSCGTSICWKAMPLEASAISA